MKALTIKQPWASLIAHGIKDIENRAWKTNFRGSIFIHASAKAAGNLPNILTPNQASFITCNVNEMPPDVKKMPYSAIIGEVDIIDCIINHPSIWAEKSDSPIKPNLKDFEINGEINWNGYNYSLENWKNNKPIYNWVLANPVLYEKPILNVKGKLSFWEPNLNVCNYCLEWCKELPDGFGCEECIKKYKKP